MFGNAINNRTRFYCLKLLKIHTKHGSDFTDVERPVNSLSERVSLKHLTLEMDNRGIVFVLDAQDGGLMSYTLVPAERNLNYLRNQ